MSVSDLQKQFDELCAQIAPAQHKCNQTYIAWQEACREWKLLARQRTEVWEQMMDSITGALPEKTNALENKAE